ncbi:prepilin-type N-terminal cleavage/methylation domain-containing protein [Paenibacillus sp. M1]|uniref:Prepilin-type N-terminal cleavage/methylation domain-containing protein n=1 Tax=Paenibacillus haidiansis TaxID=1574488 RepID=A0ABU7VSJ7_9BACL
MKFPRTRKMTSRRRFFRGEEGLTLIEVAASLVVLSIVSLYFLSYFTNSAFQSKLTNQKLSATHLANAKLHEIQNIPFEELQTEADCSKGTSYDEEKDIYVMKTEICDSASGYETRSDILYITVTTYWAPDPEHPGQFKHEVSLVGAAKK